MTGPAQPGAFGAGGGPPHRVTVGPLPPWLDVPRLLGPAGDSAGRVPDAAGMLHLTLSRSAAADLQARLRGQGLDGQPLLVQVEPALPRSAVRLARTADARRRRDTTPGFLHRGARCDAEGRLSLTPEPLALWMARGTAGLRVLDLCCGVGGNALAFARAGARVTAVELDPQRLALARHNARIYGVQSRIRFVAGDGGQALQTEAADLVFIDPPWGADYSRLRVGLHDLPLLQQWLPQVGRFTQTWLKLPPSFECAALPQAQPLAVFGQAEGDKRRIKFLWLKLRGQSLPGS